MALAPQYWEAGHVSASGGDMNGGSLFALIIWLIVLFILSVVHVPSIKIGLGLFDKITHFILYGITAILFLSVLRRRLKTKWSGIFFTISLSSLYGFMLEIVQSFISYRNFEFSDILANTIGATAFVMINYLRQ